MQAADLRVAGMQRRAMDNRARSIPAQSRSHAVTPSRTHAIHTSNHTIHVQLQQTISRLTDECWDKCVSSPSTYFSGKENACLDNCAKRFMDTTQFVIKYFNSKGRSGGGEALDEFS